MNMCSKMLFEASTGNIANNFECGLQLFHQVFAREATFDRLEHFVEGAQVRLVLGGQVRLGRLPQLQTLAEHDGRLEEVLARACEQQTHAEAPNVHAEGIVLVVPHLRWQMIPLLDQVVLHAFVAGHLFRFVGIPNEAGQLEVCQLDLALGGDEEVLGANVSMRHAKVVQVIDGSGQLAEPLADGGRGESALGGQVGQRLAQWQVLVEDVHLRLVHHKHIERLDHNNGNIVCE